MSFKVFMLTVGLAVFALLDSSEGIPTETPVTTAQKPSFNSEVVNKFWKWLVIQDRPYYEGILDNVLEEQIDILSSEDIDIIFDKINALTTEEIKGTIFLEYLERQKRLKKIGSKTDTEINKMIDLLKSKFPKTPIPVVDIIWSDIKTFSLERGEEIVSYCVSKLINFLPSDDVDIILERINALTPAEINGNFFLSLLKKMKEYRVIGNKTDAEMDKMIV